MAKILRGLVEVPTAKCAMPWHTLLSFTFQHSMVYNLASRSDFDTLRIVLPLIARDFPGEAMSKALDVADSATGGEDIHRVHQALDAVLSETVPQLIKDAVECECER